MKPHAIHGWTDASDDELVSGIRRGDDRAFAELHDRYRGPLERYAAGILGHDHRAIDDVLQDVFQRADAALRKPPSRPMVLRPWLYRITHNRCIDEIHSNRRVDHAIDINQAACVANGDPLWDEVCARLAVQDMVADIRSLPARQRKALVAVAFEGRRHEDVAARLQISVGASKSLVNRARGGLLEQRATRASVSAPPVLERRVAGHPAAGSRRAPGPFAAEQRA